MSSIALKHILLLVERLSCEPTDVLYVLANITSLRYSANFEEATVLIRIVQQST